MPMSPEKMGALPAGTDLQRHVREVETMLARQRRVSGLVHHQRMQRHELVEGLVQRQHGVELQNLLRRLSPLETARVLDALGREDRLLAWRQVDEHLCDVVLEQAPDSLREELISLRPLNLAGNMLNAFVEREGRLVQVSIASRAELDGIRPVWIDMVAPTPAVRGWVGDHFGVSLPDPGEITDIETSARFYIDDKGDARMRSDFLLDTEGRSCNVGVAFILHDGILFSIHMEELPVFRLQRLRARTQTGYVTEGRDVLLDLYAADVEYSADSLETIYADFEKVGKRVLDPLVSDDEAASTLSEIARGEDLNGRIRRNVLDTRRALSFLTRSRLLSSSQQDDVRDVLRDIESLDVHTSFLFGKINFLMDSTIGFITINQNKRVSKLTTISVVFTPINILAGIGGMSEYSMMTQGIPWPLAYAAFVLVVTTVGFSVYGALRFFERRQARLLSAARQRMLA